MFSKVKCQNCEICCSQNDDNTQSILGYESVNGRIITNVSDETAGYIRTQESLRIYEPSNFKMDFKTRNNLTFSAHARTHDMHNIIWTT